MNSRLRYGNIWLPSFDLALMWVKQLLSQQTRIMPLESGSDAFYATDFLADQALLNPELGLCEDCASAFGADYVRRYQGEQTHGIQN